MKVCKTSTPGSNPGGASSGYHSLSLQPCGDLCVRSTGQDWPGLRRIGSFPQRRNNQTTIVEGLRSRIPPWGIWARPRGAGRSVVAAIVAAVAMRTGIPYSEAGIRWVRDCCGNGSAIQRAGQASPATRPIAPWRPGTGRGCRNGRGGWIRRPRSSWRLARGRARGRAHAAIQTQQ